MPKILISRLRHTSGQQSKSFAACLLLHKKVNPDSCVLLQIRFSSFDKNLPSFRRKRRDVSIKRRRAFENFTPTFRSKARLLLPKSSRRFDKNLPANSFLPYWWPKSNLPGDKTTGKDEIFALTKRRGKRQPGIRRKPLCLLTAMFCCFFLL